MIRDVVRVDPSPLNARRWCLKLSCGHEVWVTAQRRPRRLEVECRACDEFRRATSISLPDPDLEHRPDQDSDGYKPGLPF